MLSKTIENALNQQVAEEVYASNFYLAMASWCDRKGLIGSANFLYSHSEGERAHMMKLFKYINDAGGHALVKAVKETPHEFENVSDIFAKTLEHERHVTGAINRLVELCLSEKDFSTFNFLQWYVSEQHEEERMLNSIIDLIKIAGVEGRGLFLIDKEIGKRVEAKSAAK